MLKANIFLLLIIFVILFICFLYEPLNWQMVMIYNLTSSSMPIFSKSVPLIVFYTKIFKQKNLILNDSFLENCPYQCYVSNNPKLYLHSDVAIFHSRDMKMDQFLEKHRSPNRLHLFFSREAFAHEKIRKKYFPKDFFNLTRTHRRDSNLWIPYDKFEKILPHERDNDTLVWSDKQIKEVLTKKRNLAVIFASHCKTHSVRERLIDDMKKYANISTLGGCYNKTKFNKTEEMNKHFFYLAFENAVCKDYITEKFWRIKELIVPVVLKRSILKGIVEDEYFIAADDYNSTEALVDKLSQVSQNLTEYKKYLGWTKIYKKAKGVDATKFLCELCEMAVKKEKHIIPDIYQWWENESECHFNYLNFTLNYFCDQHI